MSRVNNIPGTLLSFRCWRPTSKSPLDQALMGILHERDMSFCGVNTWPGISGGLISTSGHSEFCWASLSGHPAEILGELDGRIKLVQDLFRLFPVSEVLAREPYLTLFDRLEQLGVSTGADLEKIGRGEIVVPRLRHEENAAIKLALSQGLVSTETSGEQNAYLRIPVATYWESGEASLAHGSFLMTMESLCGKYNGAILGDEAHVREVFENGTRNNTLVAELEVNLSLGDVPGFIGEVLAFHRETLPTAPAMTIMGDCHRQYLEAAEIVTVSDLTVLTRKELWDRVQFPEPIWCGLTQNNLEQFGFSLAT